MTLRHVGLTILAAILALTGCGGDSNPAGPGGSGGPSNGAMSARVDGANWNAVANLHGIRTSGVISLSAPGPNGSVIAFAFADGAGPASHVIGVSVGTNASYTQGTSTWTAGVQGGAGTVTVTTLNAERVAGTFSFVMQAFQGATPPTRNITNGTFEYRF